jgi:D-3-phosphoglycerate dehydrogenase
MLLLSSKRNLIKSNTEVKESKWIRAANRGTELNGKTLGIIGYGNTGTAFVKAASGIGMRMIAYDKYKSGFQNKIVEEVTQEVIQKEADFISFHIPLSAENIHMCDALFLDKLGKQPFIINTSRGSVISQRDLLAALKSGQISGAALDVLENEKLDHFTLEEKAVFDALNSLSQVTITPHIAGYTHEAFYKMSTFLLNKLGVEITELR